MATETAELPYQDVSGESRDEGPLARVKAASVDSRDLLTLFSNLAKFSGVICKDDYRVLIMKKHHL